MPAIVGRFSSPKMADLMNGCPSRITPLPLPKPPSSSSSKLKQERPLAVNARQLSDKDDFAFDGCCQCRGIYYHVARVNTERRVWMAVATGTDQYRRIEHQPFRRDAADAGLCGAASRPVRRMMSLENMIAALHFHVADRNCPEEVPEIYSPGYWSA